MFYFPIAKQSGPSVENEEDEDEEEEDSAQESPTSSGSNRPISIVSIPSENDQVEKLQSTGKLPSDDDDEDGAAMGKKMERWRKRNAPSLKRLRMSRAYAVGSVTF